MPAAFDASSRTWNRSDGPRPRVMIRTASTTSRATPLVAAPSAGASGLVAWYAEGFSDALGDRLRLFDNRGPALELLRFSDAVLAIPGFEAALRTRVELLGAFKHPSFARVRALRVLDDPPAPRLALVSELVAGERVSSMLRTAQAKGVRLDTTSAVWLLRQLLPSLAALHDTGDGVVHGLLDPDRVVVTAGGEVVITEHVFGGVADRMDLAGRTSDIGQAALIAVALLLGRPLRRDEYASNGVTSLDLACASACGRRPATVADPGAGTRIGAAVRLGARGVSRARGSAAGGVGRLAVAADAGTAGRREAARRRAGNRCRSAAANVEELAAADAGGAAPSLAREPDARGGRRRRGRADRGAAGARVDTWTCTAGIAGSAGRRTGAGGRRGWRLAGRCARQEGSRAGREWTHPPREAGARSNRASRCASTRTDGCWARRRAGGSSCRRAIIRSPSSTIASRID